VDLDSRDAMLTVLLAVIEVAVVEGLVRLNLVVVERATATLFILIVLNVAFVVGLRRLRR
jgi:hypothetical protein